MASFLYPLGCITLALLAWLELKSRNRAAYIQAYVLLLCVFAFGGLFALLLTAANSYRLSATLGVLLLAAAGLYVFARISRRFRILSTGRDTI